VARLIRLTHHIAVSLGTVIVVSDFDHVRT
jgi:hypothetical protein